MITAAGAFPRVYGYRIPIVGERNAWAQGDQVATVGPLFAFLKGALSSSGGDEAGGRIDLGQDTFLQARIGGSFAISPPDFHA